MQGLKEEGDCESMVLSFSILITNSRLGELSFVPVKFLMRVMILKHCDFQLNSVGCESRSMYDMIGTFGWFDVGFKVFYTLYERDEGFTLEWAILI